ncbi:hypothetical protein ACHAQH_005172 [Verticillium albo-atrum]
MSTPEPKTEANSPASGVAHARRLRKRELDRKAQRLARERKNDRIAYLEELVEQMSHNDTNAEVLRLTERWLQTTQEKDKLMGVLASLETTIRRHTDAFSAQSGCTSTSVANIKPAMRSLPDAAASPSYREKYHMPGTWVPPLPTDFGWGLDSPTVPPIDEMPTTRSFSRHATQVFDRMQPAPFLPDSELSSEIGSYGDHFIIPQPAEPCHCSSVTPVGHDNHGSNVWREFNYALGKPTKLSQLAVESEDRTSQDTPVRAIVEGWDSVERMGMMTSSWRKLRILDDLCFSKCGSVERLATLKMMHTMITCHSDSSPERMATLPQWFRGRPSQSLPHSYAIDFFVWPGLRERFVFSQHQYCANLFWQLFRSNLTILWQFGFNDCFMRNTATGLFQLSPIFEDRIRDIRSWTMNVDFLDRFPELRDDIPGYGGIPPITSTPSNVSWSMSLHTRAWETEHEEEAQMTQPAENATGFGFEAASLATVSVHEQPSKPLSITPESVVPNNVIYYVQQLHSGGPSLYSYCHSSYT